MWYVVCLLATVAFATSLPSEKNTVIKSESDLRRILFEDYDKLVRPVKNHLTTVTLYASLTPTALKEVDEKNQVLVLDSWVALKWKDEAFVWDPLQFGNITDLRLPSSEIWKPDISVYTATPDTSLFPTCPTQVIVYSNSDVLWVPMYTISSRCPMTRKGDKNTIVCNIKMGSWTYSGPLLDLQLLTPEVDLTNFQDIHPEWKLQGVTSNRESKYYPCCAEPYPALHFNVTLKRRDAMRNIKNEVWPSMA